MTGTYYRILACIILPFCAVTVAASQAKQSGSTPVKRKVVIDGKTIAAAKVITREGTPYVELAAVAEALGAAMKTSDTAITIVAQPACDPTMLGAEGQRFSHQFRSDVAGVADEIESLRAVVMKKEKVALGPRFDAIDRKLTLATTHVQTDADKAVYYALSYANNSLAIAYYKQERGVPSEEAQKDQLDSMMCSMESKFALMKGVLLPGGTCSVFERIEAQPPAKPSQP